MENFENFVTPLDCLASSHGGKQLRSLIILDCFVVIPTHPHDISAQFDLALFYI